MEIAVSHIRQITTIEGVLQFLRDTGHSYGVVRQSYHFTPLFHSPVSADTIIYAEGFDEAWTKLYFNKDFRARDPIPAWTLKHAGLLAWKDAIAAHDPTPDQAEYFAQMEAFGLIHGFGLPLYGPNNRVAYVAFDFGRPICDEDKLTIDMLRAVAQAGHLRICEIIDGEHEIPDLSERELEVMTWIARGKSGTDIATILGLSPETVKTYTRRIYEKLEVGDKVGATVKALKLGLVTV